LEMIQRRKWKKYTTRKSNREEAISETGLEMAFALGGNEPGECMKILMISLGCDKNLVDTENMLGLLSRDGHTFTDDEEEAEAIIVNTCCFIGDAKEESIQTILEMAELKERGKCRSLIVTGCLAQRYRQEILEEIPEVDGLLGTASWDGISQVLKETGEERHSCFASIDRIPETEGERILTTGGHYAFLKIAEGCDKFCTYCIIPSLRGHYRSIPMERLLKEAESLAGKGVRELILVAQETTLYGVDLYGKKMLPELLHRLAEISGIYWIRIQYCYPEEITDELIEAIRTEEKVCHYLDIPIQHASDRVLKRMGRKTNQASIREMVEKLRREIPDIVLRTTLITGFPGEEEADHQELIEFVDEMEFERLGVFAYSAEEDTPAADFPDQVPEELKEMRRNEVMELQQEIAFEKSQSMVGRVLDVMIEGKVADEPAYVARTYMDAPGVDGYLFVNSGELFMSGDFVRVKVTGACEYDLIGEVFEERDEKDPGLEVCDEFAQ
jgi:ribosomal protein S12 methylthiotransferase